MIRLAKRVAGALRASDLRCEAVSLLLSDGSAAGQEIFHVHLHVIPRYVGDSCGLRLHLMPPGRPERTVLDEQAAVLKDILHG
jgi:diadenosine tetraphosphate (Ap4A) HIT family hydrolase